MQPYRAVKPHLGTTCPQCAPERPGHPLCQAETCDEIATASLTPQHLTAQEYAALPDAYTPLDGVAVKPVHACDEHAEDTPPFCTHPASTPAKCPKCGASGDAPCTLKSGDPRWTWHTARTQAQPPLEQCRHAHRPECTVFEGCQCTALDTPPARTPRTAPGTLGPDISGLTVPLHLAQMILASAGIPWLSALRVWSLYTQDNQPAVGAEIYALDEAGHRTLDGHGHPLTRDTVVPLPSTTPGLSR